MKTLLVMAAVALASSLSAMGKAYFCTRPELIENAVVIGIVTIDEPEAAPDPFAEPTTRFAYAQQAKVHVEQVIKGEIPKEFILHGGESFICAQTTLAKGRFLAFLSKDGDRWVGTNWMLSLRPIKDQEVEWYVADEQRFPMKFQSLAEVVAAIKTAVAKPPGEPAADGKPPTGHP